MSSIKLRGIGGTILKGVPAPAQRSFRQRKLRWVLPQFANKVAVPEFESRNTLRWRCPNRPVENNASPGSKTSNTADQTQSAFIDVDAWIDIHILEPSSGNVDIFSLRHLCPRYLRDSQLDWNARAWKFQELLTLIRIARAI